MLSVFIPGLPPSKGSFRSVGKGRFINASKLCAPWTKRFQAELQKSPNSHAYAVTIVVHLERPKKHFKRAELREDAPAWCLKRPDLDKVARAVLDGMTGYVYDDDSQVIHLTVQREWAHAKRPPGVEVVVAPVL